MAVVQDLSDCDMANLSKITERSVGIFLDDANILMTDEADIN